MQNFANTSDQALLELLPKVRLPWQSWTQEKTEAKDKNCYTEIRKPLTDTRLLKLYRSDSKMLALPLGERTRYFILDIDSGSAYHNKDSILRLIDLFKARRIILHTCQSSPNGGIHLLGIFTRRVHVKRLIPLLAPLLERRGFEVSPGKLEVWPSKSTKNSPVRLPFQNQKGYYLLDPNNDLAVVHYPTSPEDNISIFLSLEQTDPDKCNLKPPPVKQVEEPVRRWNFEAERYNSGKRFYEEGLSGPRQRYNALFCINYYLFLEGYGYDRKEDRYQLMVEWMSQKNNGYSREWLTQRKTVLKKIRSMAYSDTKNGEAHHADSSRFFERNIYKSADCRTRLIYLSKDLALSGELYLKNGRINLSAIAARANVNRRTAKKYEKLIETTGQKAMANLQDDLIAI